MTNITDFLFSKSKFLKKELILGPEEKINYDQAYQLISALAEWIQQQGLKRQDKILLSADNSIFFIICYFGIIKSGCTCVPVDTRASEVTLDYILARFGVSLPAKQPFTLESLKVVNPASE